MVTAVAEYNYKINILGDVWKKLHINFLKLHKNDFIKLQQYLILISNDLRRSC